MDKRVEELYVMKKKYAVVHDESNKLKGTLIEMISKYSREVTPEVHKILLGLQWQKLSRVSGLRSMLEASVPSSNSIVATVKMLHEVTPEYYSHFIFGGVCLSVWDLNSKVVRIQALASELRRIGYKFPRNHVDGEVRQKISRLIKKHGLTPEQLEQMLKEQKE